MRCLEGIEEHSQIAQVFYIVLSQNIIIGTKQFKVAITGLIGCEVCYDHFLDIRVLRLPYAI